MSHDDIESRTVQARMRFLRWFTVVVVLAIVAASAFVIWTMFLFHGGGVGAMGLSGCDDSDALSRAALHELNSKIPYVSDTGVWTGRVTQSDVDEVRQRVAHYQRWVDGLEDACVKRAYQGWLNYFTRQADQAQTEIRDGRIRKEMEQARAEWAREDDARDKASLTMPKPPD